MRPATDDSETKTIDIILPNGRRLRLSDLDAEQYARAREKFKDAFEQGKVTHVTSKRKQEPDC